MVSDQWNMIFYESQCKNKFRFFYLFIICLPTYILCKPIKRLVRTIFTAHVSIGFVLYLYDSEEFHLFETRRKPLLP